jgi:hypothetical protein
LSNVFRGSAQVESCFAMGIAEVIVAMAAAYAGMGFVFALGFAGWGAAAIDNAVHGAPLSFRLLIIPGAVALWPLLAVRWLQRRKQRSVK